jgi:filamentous hemagglutinin family protein
MNAWAFRLRPIADFLRRNTPSRLGWGALASIPGLALAGPSGENVVAGGAVVSRPNATHTQVDQSTARAVVNWSTFSVDSDEYVVFNQPGATASILNRVVGANQSQIFGQIDANGRVFLVNPQGVYFAPGAQVNAAALTASVMDITNNNFMSGNYVFTRPAGAPDGATVENAGQINVSDGGFVVLAGDYANNSGIISARLGSVVLAAGSQMTLDLSDDGLVSFAVDEATVSSLAGANNSGQILADGGQVIMTAKVANDLVATAVNNDGLLQARRIVADGGEIYLSAAGADIVQAGTIDVSGENGQSGGEVGITGDANITLTAGSQINANGSGAGNGGTVNVIADGTMAFRRDAEISARAGTEGERGGKVELSGHEGIQVRGNLQLGKGGELVIDPAVVGLVAGSGSYGGSYGSTIGVGFIENQLNTDVDVSVLASNAIFASSGVTNISATEGSGALTLRVTGPGGGAPVSFTFSGSSGTNILTDGNIELSGVTINIAGDFTASAGTMVGSVNLGKVTAGNVRIFTGSSGGDITLNTGGIAAASSVLRLSAADDINIGTMVMPGNLNLTGGTVNVDIDAGGNINVAGNLTASATTGSADVNVDAGGNISMGNVVATASGNDADISISAVGNVNLGDVRAISSNGDASIDIMATNITVNNVRADASTGSAFLDFFATNNLVVNGITTAVARDELSISYSASNDVTINNTINATATSNSYASIEIRAGNNVQTRNINAIASNSGGSAFVTIDATSGNVAVNGTITAIGSFDDAEIDIDAGGNITVGTAMNPGGLVAYGSDASIDLSAGGNVTVHGTIDASASIGSAYVEIDAGNDIDIDNVMVYGVSYASLDLSAGRDIVTNNAEAEIGAGSYGGSYGGSAYINFSAERDITAGNLEAVAGESGGRAVVNLDSGRLLKVKNVTAEAMGSGSGSGSYGGSSAARVSLEAFSGIDAMNLAATAQSGNARIIAETTNGPLKTLGLKAISSNSSAGVTLQANTATSTITVGGAVEVSGTAAMFSASAFNINLNGDVDLTAPSYVDMYTMAANNLVVNGDITAREAGGGMVNVGLFAAKAATINGDVKVTGGPGSYAFLDIGTDEDAMVLPVNTVNVVGDISVVSGRMANAVIFGRNVSAPGKITVRGVGTPSMGGDINAGLAIWAVNNLSVAGDVLVSNPTGNAGTQYLFGGNATVGKHIVNGGTNGWGIALFNATDPAGGIASLPSGFVRGNNVIFGKLLDTNGGAGSRVVVDVQNSITTGVNGLIDAQYADFTTRANITTDINVKTRTMSTTLQNLGQTPNVRLDNRAFIGPSSVNFNSGTVLKAASFFASGALTFNGGFTADNLAVGVTNGTATFSGPVNITGATPFLPTAPDLALFGIMTERGLLPPGHGPNVQIFAQNGININQTFNVRGPNPFTKMYTNGPFNVSGLTTSSSSLLAVFSPIDTTRPIFFENEPYLQPLGASAFFNFPTISGLPNNPNVTVVLGERGPAAPLLNGPLTIGARGLIDLGERNMFIITRGAVSGDDTVITDGIFEIIGLAQDNFFQVPLVNEFGEEPETEEEDDDDDEDELVLGDGEGDDGEDGGVTQEGSGSESMECS